MTRLFPTSADRMVNIDETRRVEGGLTGWQAQWNRRRRRYEAVMIFVPVA